MVAFTRCATTDSPNATSADGKIVVVGTANVSIGVARLTADGQLDAPKVTQYAWDQGYIDTPVVRFQDANGDGDTADAGETLYYTTDANHNVTGLVGQVLVGGTLQWKVVERYVYDAYGKVTICNGNVGGGIEDWSRILVGGAPVSASPLGNEILYCGYRYDPETAITTTTLTGAFGSYQVRYRQYNVLLSQWTTPDPMGYAAGDANLRRYCGNRAVMATDPMGLDKVVGADGGDPPFVGSICYRDDPTWRSGWQASNASYPAGNRVGPIVHLPKNGKKVSGIAGMVTDPNDRTSNSRYANKYFYRDIELAAESGAISNQEGFDKWAADARTRYRLAMKMKDVISQLRNGNYSPRKATAANEMAGVIARKYFVDDNTEGAKATVDSLKVIEKVADLVRDLSENGVAQTTFWISEGKAGAPAELLGEYRFKGRGGTYWTEKVVWVRPQWMANIKQGGYKITAAETVKVSTKLLDAYSFAQAAKNFVAAIPGDDPESSVRATQGIVDMVGAIAPVGLSQYCDFMSDSIDAMLKATKKLQEMGGEMNLDGLISYGVDGADVQARGQGMPFSPDWFASKSKVLEAYYTNKPLGPASQR